LTSKLVIILKDWKERIEWRVVGEEIEEGRKREALFSRATLMLSVP
jgi:hypothetical protein